MSKKVFVTGIGTDVGKTLVAAMLVAALEADYWKPVQSGALDKPDRDTVRSLASRRAGTVFPESYRLTQHSSPHASAAHDKVRVTVAGCRMPDTANTLIIEGAGGLLVPLNEKELVIDLIAALGVPVLLVSRHYLGSINHTLLSCEALAARKIPILGIVFNGSANTGTEEVIEARTGLPVVGRIPQIDNLSADAILAEGQRLAEAIEKVW